MRIKTTKQMRLDELIKYMWDSGLENYHFFCDTQDAYVRIIDGGVYSNYRYTEEDTFTVETEEELTEETEFDELWEVYYNKGRDDVDAYTDGKVNGVTSTSISQILEENSIDYENVTLAIFRKDTLIWGKDTGIPTEGVIECS